VQLFRGHNRISFTFLGLTYVHCALTNTASCPNPTSHCSRLAREQNLKDKRRMLSSQLQRHLYYFALTQSYKGKTWGRSYRITIPGRAVVSIAHSEAFAINLLYCILLHSIYVLWLIEHQPVGLVWTVVRYYCTVLLYTIYLFCQWWSIDLLYLSEQWRGYLLFTSTTLWSNNLEWALNMLWSKNMQFDDKS
jgi:hypothetical protein